MVKNHSKKNDARTLIANTGQNLTSAMDEVSGLAKMPTIYSKLHYKGNQKTLAELFVGCLTEIVCDDFITLKDYNDIFENGSEGFDLRSIAFTEGYWEDKTVTVDDFPQAPSSDELLALYGTWNDVNIAAGNKSFNGYIVSHTFVENTAPLFAGGVSGVEEWPEWVERIGSWVAIDIRDGEGVFNKDIFSKSAIRELESDTGSGVLAGIELATKYSSMALALRNGVAPDPVVLKQWQAHASESSGYATTVPTDAQLSVLEQARKYL